MGLDMYLYNVKKCSLEEGKTYTAEQLQDFKNLVTCDISDKVCDTIKNHSTKITCIEKVIVLCYNLFNYGANFAPIKFKIKESTNEHSNC